MSSIYIYWDESHFWGLMARRALAAWGLPHRLVRGTEIAQGLLADNPPGLLLVPGGWARGKAERLGDAGIEAVRALVRDGGSYLGFCGGAGLALSGGGLSLCPWRRRAFTDRMQHFMSGHVHVDFGNDHILIPKDMSNSALLPVWWPGRFEPADNDVEILATYNKPGPDFWMADLALKSLPKGTASDWENLYGVRIRPDFEGLPAVISGRFGQGRYVLSYAHLETPASPQANRWLTHILAGLTGLPEPEFFLPAWDPAALPVLWPDLALNHARELLLDLVRTGKEQMLLFWRTPWLLGWRRGLPGAALNSLLNMVCEALASPPTQAALEYWEPRAREFSTAMALFHQGVSGYLLAERLSMTVYSSSPDAVPGLREQRESLFGTPPAGGGLHANLLARLEELLWRL